MVTFYRRLPGFEYLIPGTISEALSLLWQYRKRAKIIVGGTDLLPKIKRRQIEVPEYLIDLKGIPDMDYIKYDESEGLRLGALTTIHSVETAPIIGRKFSVLAQAAASMASVQVRNRGTIAGNICNAVPSADSAPALLVLQAKLKIASQESERTVEINSFFTGPNKTVLGDEELLTEIVVPSLPPESKGVYLKLSPRRSMDLAVVGVAVVIVPQDGICADVRIALGAVSPSPMRAQKAEHILKGKRFSKHYVELTAQMAAQESRPIDDHRASAEYRREMVRVLTQRAINQLL